MANAPLISLPEDDDDVVVALETARALIERGEFAESVRWLQRAAGAARKQGRPERAGDLSRLAARLGGDAEAKSPPPPKYERIEDKPQILGEEDEFADKTIVDEVPRAPDLPGELDTFALAPPTIRTPPVVRTPPMGPGTPSTPPRPSRGSAGSPVAAEKAAAQEQLKILERPTPVAPLAQRKENASAHFGVRVAVKRSLGGSFEVRRLELGDPLVSGEEEALLVPLRPGVKLT